MTHNISELTSSSLSGCPKTHSKRPTISILVPCFNEEAVIHATHTRLKSVSVELPNVEFEFIYVNDGSADSTASILRSIAQSDPSVRMLSFSRNFGHQAAVTAAMEAATGDALVLIDADLQDPPELIPEMIRHWQSGYDVVYGVRTDREGETAFKLLTAKLFYRILNALSEVPIPADTGDFRLIDRRVAAVLRKMPEKDRFIRGMVSWVGFRQHPLPYQRAQRFAGTTKYSFLKMLRFATDGILSFSSRPISLVTNLGIAISAFSVLCMAYALIVRLFSTQWVSGWTTLFALVAFLGGMQMIAIGICGSYIARIYSESKKRPPYVIAEQHGFPSDRELLHDYSRR